MNPLLGIAFTVIPDLIRLVAGDRTGSVADDVVNKVKEVAEEQDEDAAATKIESDPELKTSLQKQLADIALALAKEQKQEEEAQNQANLELIQAQFAEDARIRDAEFKRLEQDIADRAGARDLFADMARSNAPFAWINPALSLLITGGFIIIVYLLMFKYSDVPEKNSEVFYIAIGALATAFATVIGFHFGSSSGSKQKDDILSMRADLEELNRLRRGDPRPAGPARDRRPASDDGADTDDTFTEPAGPGLSGDADAINSSSNFAEKAPSIMRLLMRDFSLTPVQSAAILGNIGVECAGFQKMQEQNPRSGRGGFGWCQWTGSRRRAFERWASGMGLELASDAANYGFLKHELTETSERRVLPALRKADTVNEATRLFMKIFERPGVEHLDRRVKFANEALAAFPR